MDKFKPGGGNKTQPYVPTGNGKESGQYTNGKGRTKNEVKTKRVNNCFIKNKALHYNFKDSKLVGKVLKTSISGKGVSISKNGAPNSVIKKAINGFVVTERYYNNKGEAYLDIDYTCHKNPKAYPCVPHIHWWYHDDNGKLVRSDWEAFK